MTGRKPLICSVAYQQIYSAYIVRLRVFEAQMKSYAKGFCQVKQIPKIREKLGSGWVGMSSPNSDFFFFFGNFVFFRVFCVVFMF